MIDERGDIPTTRYAPSPSVAAWRGVYAIAITPLNADFTVDFLGLRANLKYLAAENAGPIVCLGSESESYALSDYEREAVVATAVEAVDGRRPLIIGVSHPSSLIARQFARHAREQGVDAVLATAPFFGQADESALLDHFSAIADVGLPLFLYNSPGRVGYDLSLPLVQRLLTFDGIVGIKQTNLQDLADLISDSENNRSLLVGGSESLILPAMAIGAIGNTATAASALPSLFGEFVNDLQEQRYDHARQLYAGPLGTLRRAYREAGGQAPVVKALMEEVGLAGGPVRPPLRSVSPELRSRLRESVASLSGAAR